jgi:hypothetical protein
LAHAQSGLARRLYRSPPGTLLLSDEAQQTLKWIKSGYKPEIEEAHALGAALYTFLFPLSALLLRWRKRN